jgi:hypothetical protein
MTIVTRERPAGVTILALLCFIAGGSSAYGTRIFGSWLLHPLAGVLLNPIAGLAVIVGLAAAFVQAGFFIAIGIGLLKMQNWARVLLIVLSGLEFLAGVRAVVASAAPGTANAPGPALLVLACSVGVLIYLFTPRVKEAFGAARF